MNGHRVMVFSLSKDGSHKVSDHFKVREFSCQDGSDTVFISEELIDILEDVRKHFNVPVNVTSGYRNDAHNKKVKGANFSMHKYGRAADIKVSGVGPITVYQYLDSKYPNTLGLGLYGTFVHVDDREACSRWKD